ncbi:hypothetical protein EDB80DRAFT_156683 [Ilyonectria destructans]|nr:hypothetical protein EDB80DRAFT_156683 [Ilyonectria destructans]
MQWITAPLRPVSVRVCAQFWVVWWRWSAPTRMQHTRIPPSASLPLGLEESPRAGILNPELAKTELSIGHVASQPLGGVPRVSERHEGWLSRRRIRPTPKGDDQEKLREGLISRSICSGPRPRFSLLMQSDRSAACNPTGSQAATPLTPPHPHVDARSRTLFLRPFSAN